MSQTGVVKLSKDQWADAALEAIGRGGLRAVAVEPIALALGVTKGSFYWHFANRNELLQAAMQRWAFRATTAIIEGLADIDDPRERLSGLFRFAFAARDESAIEDAIMASLTDPIVAASVNTVHAERIAYLVGIFKAMGFSPAAARYRARLAYSALLGHWVLQQAPDSTINERNVRQLCDDFTEMLTRS